MAAVPQPTLDMPADTITPGGAKMAPPPAVYNAPAPSTSWAPTDPLAGVPQGPGPQAPGTGVMQGYDPLRDTAPLNPPREPTSFTREDPSAVSGVAGPPAPTDQRPAISLAGGGGAYGAREVSRLGPTQWKALADSDAFGQQAVGQIAANNAKQAQRDEDVYLQHALDARKREDAAGQVALQREDELRSRAADFDRQARMLSQEKLDPGRFWATRSTPQKVSAFVAIALGGFLSGAKGGENLALNQINHEIDKDIKAQEISYGMKRGGLEAAHTAYGMAMQRYQSADAARAFARVSAMDAVAAEIARQQAQGKGTESQNRAIAALKELDGARTEWILKGIQLIPGGYAEPKYRIANRLGTYTAKEIDQQFATEEGRGFELQKIDRHAEGELRKEGAKAGKSREAMWVPTSSTGKGYYAPTEKEAVEHRELQASTQEVIDLADRIKTANAKIGYTGRVAASAGMPSGDAKKVEADSIALIGALNRMQKFGALDKGAQDLLTRMSGNPLAVLGNDDKLDAIRTNAFEKRRQIEKSSTGTKPDALPTGTKGGSDGKQAW